MKKLLTTLLVILAASAAFAVSSDYAPKPVDQNYVVQKGDTLWGLSEVYLKNPHRWHEIMSANPWLSSRIHRRGHRVIVLIRPGETLAGVTKQEVETGIQPPPPPQVVEPPSLQTAPLPVEAQSESSSLWTPFLWLLFFVVLAILVGALYLRNQFRKDPVTSGTPIIPGGIRPTQTNVYAAAEQRLQEMANNRQTEMYGAGLARPYRNGPIEEGFLNGHGLVQYADGRREPRHFVNEPAFRARFRFADSHEEELVFLQGCGNDVWYFGTRYHGFTFTSRSPLEPPAESQPEQPASTLPEPIAPTMPEAPAPRGQIRVMPTISGPTVVNVGGVEMTIPAGARLHVKEDGTVGITVDGATVAVAPDKAASNKAASA